MGCPSARFAPVSQNQLTWVPSNALHPYPACLSSLGSPVRPHPRRCCVLPAGVPRMPQPGLGLGGRAEAVRDPGGQDLHHRVEGILGAILAQVRALQEEGGSTFTLVMMVVGKTGGQSIRQHREAGRR